ncbi:hypothetical protein LXL04_006454 [Taraxacum kok-saghyz]
MLNRINSRLYRPSISSTHSWILDAQLLKGGQCLSLNKHKIKIIRRAMFKLKQAQDKNHIVDLMLLTTVNILFYLVMKGILIGLDNIDDVIDVIRKATSNSVASADLRKNFQLSEKQAEAILDINLRRLTMLERNKYVNEGKSLKKQISNLEELLSSRKQILQVIEQEANEIKNKFSTPRHTNKSKIQECLYDDMLIMFGWNHVNRDRMAGMESSE